MSETSDTTGSSPESPESPDSTESPGAQDGGPWRHVTEEEVEQAMGINSVPDEVRLHSDDPDETTQTMDSTGRLRDPADRG